MKANELRLGNYVFLKSKLKNYEISSGHDIEEIDDAPENFDAEPIPLTEEWLLKFGFITKGIHYNFTLGNMEIASAIRVLSTNERGKFYLDGDIPEWMKIKLEYVHQLQNLYFVFAGEELEIKN
jgi:hypothetical protein